MSRIVITGGTGFLGRHLTEYIIRTKHDYVFPLSSKDCDLTDLAKTKKCFTYSTSKYYLKPDIVINLAAVVGGIGANANRSPEFMRKNLTIGLNLFTALYQSKRFRETGKLVQIGTVCSYPKFAKTPFKEEDLWNGYPEETNAAYGIAKKTIMELLIQHKKAGLFNAINLIPVNLYGPGDNFDEKTSHVIPALIKKFIHARNKELKNVEVWGTGYATREFIHVKDAARAIALATQDYDGYEPINIGCGVDISIRDLSYLIKEIVDYRGIITFNTSKPDGQPKRLLDITKAYNNFGFKPEISLKDGLKETIKCYEELCKE